jgi:hypothetical protein
MLCLQNLENKGDNLQNLHNKGVVVSLELLGDTNLKLVDSAPYFKPKHIGRLALRM